ncbi:MAG: HPr family phosphocarrier protein [Parachlamydiaceae bacterium]
MSFDTFLDPSPESENDNGVKRVISKVQVKNSMGLHTRPATTIVKILQNYKCDVHFVCRKETVNAKSILNLLILAAQKNSKITIIATGVDAEEASAKLIEAFDNEFGE